MIDIHFTLNGVDKIETAVFHSLEDMQGFLKTFEKEVLEQYPEAKNIKWGKCYVGI